MSRDANSEDVCVRQAERIAARVVEGRALVIVIDERKIHALNPIGSRIWELADGRSLRSIVDAIVSEFDVDRKTASDDVQSFVKTLEELGALVVTKGDVATPGEQGASS